MYISFLQRLAPQLVVYCPVTDPQNVLAYKKRALHPNLPSTV